MSTDTQKLSSRLWVRGYDFDPDSTDPVDVAWVDARPFKSFLFQFIRTVGTSNIDTFRVIGNTATNGSGTDVVIKTKSLTSAQPNALGDNAFIEVSADEINAAGVAAGVELIGVSLQIEFATNSDEGIVDYILGDSRHSYLNLTADYIS